VDHRRTEGVGKATLAGAWRGFSWRSRTVAAAVQSAESLAVPADHPAASIAPMAPADIFKRRAWNDKTKKHFTEIRTRTRKVIQAFHQASGRRLAIAIVDCADDLTAPAPTRF
jgi:DNA polymerase-3 subunit delta'